MESIIQHLGQTDIYLLDQIMKGRYSPTDRVLDAGAGAGRNLLCFVQSGFQVFGTDRDPGAVEQLRLNYPGVPAGHFKVATVEDLPFPDAYFEHVISSAVLHFAESEAHFDRMFGEMMRVLRPGGSLFIRMTTDAGLEDKVIALGHGRFHLPDGSDRFLLSRSKLESLLLMHSVRLLEPFKTVLVEELRSMAVIVLEK